MRIDLSTQNTSARPAGAQDASRPGVPKDEAPYNPIMDSDKFVKHGKSDINLKSLALKVAVGSAVGAGVIILSGGSALAALGFSTAIGAGLGIIKGVAGAFVNSINFGGHSGSGSAIDRDPKVGAFLFGTIGVLKGAAEGAVLGAMTSMGFGVAAGAVAGAVMPVVEQGAWHLFENRGSSYKGTR